VNGIACSADTDCCSGRCNGACMEKLPDGAQCAESSDCLNNLCVDAGGANSDYCGCIPNGAPANANSDCCSNNRQGSTCQCVLNTHCPVGQVCNAGPNPNVCQTCPAGATLSDFAACSSDAACCSGDCANPAGDPSCGGSNRAGNFCLGQSGSICGSPLCCLSGVCSGGICT
jgi:hypothetical protein